MTNPKPIFPPFHDDVNYSRLFYDAPDAMFLIERSDDPSLLQTLKVNDAAAELLGYTQEELLEISLTDLMHSDHGSSLLQAVKHLPEGPFSLETELRGKNGISIFAEARLKLIGMDSAAQILAVFRDITERRLAERRLAETERRHKNHFTYNNNVMISFDPQGRFIVTNDAATISVSGYKREELINLCFLEVIPPFERENTWFHFQEALKGNIQNYESVFIDRRGNRKNLSIVNVPVYEEGQIVGVDAIIQDITEKKKAERLLDGQNRVLELIAQSAPLCDTLIELVHIVEEYSGLLCSVLLFDPEKEQLFIGAAPSLPKDYTAIVNGLPVGPANGSCGTAVYTKALVIVDDIENDIRWSDFRNDALQYDLRACWSIPILSSDQVLGTFAMYAKKTQAPDPQHLKLIEKACHLAKLAIERKQSEEIIHRMAYYDYLTGLPNRPMFQQQLMEAIEEASQSGETFALMYLDLDRFKLINDTFGNRQGDLLLQEITERLKTSLHENDMISRQGGDEFAILRRNITNIETFQCAQSIIDDLSEPFIINDLEFFITPSIGISLYPLHGDNPELLIQYADSAMYQAKKNGKNNYHIYGPELGKNTSRRLSLERDLRNALKQKEFTLHYQPQIDLFSGAIVGVEALIRWNHGTEGLIPPSEFIPIAEETGLIVPIGEWVLHTVCLQQIAWQTAGFRPLTASVNLSLRQFNQPDLIGRISAILKETGCDPCFLELELTESMTMDIAAARKTIHEIRSLGIQIAIDDFGTGYSSLSYLKELPINRLKIDRSFIRDITEDMNDRDIVQAIIAMSHNLKLGIVAEGVETEKQLAILRENHCDQAQGYFFSKPVPAEEIEKIFRSRGM